MFKFKRGIQKIVLQNVCFYKCRYFPEKRIPDLER